MSWNTSHEGVAKDKGQTTKKRLIPGDVQFRLSANKALGSIQQFIDPAQRVHIQVRVDAAYFVQNKEPEGICTEYPSRVTIKQVQVLRISFSDKRANGSVVIEPDVPVWMGRFPFCQNAAAEAWKLIILPSKMQNLRDRHEN